MHRARTKRQGGRHATPIHDPTSGDHWHAHHIGNLRQKGKQADELRLGRPRVMAAPNTAGLRALHDHAGSPCRFNCTGLSHGA